MVVDELSVQLFTAERLTAILAELCALRASRVAEIDGRIATLQREIFDAGNKLKRLYRIVEDGIAELDDILKLDRERNQAALDRIRATAAPATDIAPHIIERFGRAMRENITTGEIPFRKAYLRSVIDRIEVDDNVVRIIGNKTTLEQAARGKGFAASGVRNSARKWRARKDSNL